MGTHILGDGLHHMTYADPKFWAIAMIAVASVIGLALVFDALKKAGA